MKRAISYGILALLLCTTPVFGQATKGSITVTVTDDSGAPIPGALVEVKSDQTLSQRNTTTDASGTANLPALDPASNYIVTTTMDSFNGARNENVLVKAGQNTPIRVALTLATVSE